MTELATFTPYGPPYWDEKAWDDSDRDPFEKKLLAGLRMQNIRKLDQAITKETRRNKALAEPVGKGRLFGLTDVPGDILAGVRHDHDGQTPRELFDDWQAEYEQLVAAWDHTDLILAEATVDDIFDEAEERVFALLERMAKGPRLPDLEPEQEWPQPTWNEDEDGDPVSYVDPTEAMVETRQWPNLERLFA